MATWEASERFHVHVGKEAERVLRIVEMLNIALCVVRDEFAAEGLPSLKTDDVLNALVNMLAAQIIRVGYNRQQLHEGIDSVIALLESPLTDADIERLARGRAT